MFDVHLRRVDETLLAWSRSLTRDELSSGPPGKWTTAEIIEHLGRAFSGTAKGLERVLAQDAPACGPATLRSRLGALVVITCGYLPPGRQSPAVALPVGGDPATVIDVTRRHLATLNAALATAAERFGERRPVLQHPILGPLSVGQWRKFHWVHTRHHARQVEARRARRD